MKTRFITSYAKLTAVIGGASPIAMLVGWFHSGA